jgi:hypothetical protein
MRKRMEMEIGKQTWSMMMEKQMRTSWAERTSSPFADGEPAATAGPAFAP